MTNEGLPRHTRHENEDGADQDGGDVIGRQVDQNMDIHNTIYSRYGGTVSTFHWEGSK